MAATLEIHFLTLKYTHCQFCQNYPKKVAKIKLILAKLAFATNYEVCSNPIHIIIKVQLNVGRTIRQAQRLTFEHLIFDPSSVTKHGFTYKPLSCIYSK
jgi:hypothetical protein